jgi:hypothetical protein
LTELIIGIGDLIAVTGMYENVEFVWVDIVVFVDPAVLNIVVVVMVEVVIVVEIGITSDS